MGTKKNNEMQVVNGITVCGEKIRRDKNAFQAPEDSAINFSSTGERNVGKIAVYLLRDEVFGRIFSPSGANDFEPFFHSGEILHEDEDSFIIKQIEFPSGGCNQFVMKHPETYSFFRIVDTEKEVEAIRTLIENYAERLFEAVGDAWPFGTTMFEELEESVYENGYPGAISTEVQEEVLAKLKQTKFKSSYL